MTCLEVSICRDAIRTYRPFVPTNRTMWHYVADKTLKALVSKVLNHQRVVYQNYRKLNLPTVLGLIGRFKKNAHVIDQQHSWIINTKTCHPLHYVGSEKALSLTFKANSKYRWQKLQTFASNMHLLARQFSFIAYTILMASLLRSLHSKRQSRPCSKCLDVTVKTQMT